MHYRRDTCRLCGSRKLDVALHYTPTPLADAYVPAKEGEVVQAVYPLDLYLCRDCGFTQLCDIVRADSIYVDYIYETKSSLGLVDHFRSYADDILGRVMPPRGSLVVDIGSNDGTLLRRCKERGMAVLGVDPAHDIARSATASGIETLPEFFTVELSRRIRRDRGAATIVTANNIFANVDDLDEFTDAARTLLGPDGVFVIESSYLGDLIENKIFDFIYHEHLSSFRVAPLVPFFRRHGMELMHVQRVPTKGGSLRYTIQLASGRRPVTAAVAELLAEENRRGLDRLETFKAFAADIAALKDQLHALLDRLVKENKTVAGYGASATSTTFIYELGLGQYLSYLVDEYPRKQNTLSPGLHLPVLPPQTLIDRKTDYVLVLAWRYIEPILSKNQAYRNNGGRFILPLPKLQVI